MTSATSPMPPPQLAALEGRYLLFRMRGERGVQRRTLPLTIGAGGECDVIVNTASAAPLAYVVHTDAAGRLACYNVKSGEHQPVDAVRAFGLQIIGSGKGAAPAKTGLPGGVAEALQREAAWFDRLETPSPKLKRLLGASLPQPLRLGAWGLAAAALAALLVWANGEPSHPDLSTTPLTMTFGSPRLEIIGASPVRHGYERGATLTFDAPKSAGTQSALLSFKTMALNKPKELSLRLNGRDIYASEVDPACIDAQCVKQIQVPKGAVLAGKNVLQVIHDQSAGSYMMQAILIEPLPAMSLEERELADRWMQLARRFYDERGIVTDNLLAARIHIEKTIDLLGRRAVSNETEGRLAVAKVLQQEIAGELDQAIKDAWADVGVNERLGRPDEATKSLNVLLRLYPNPSSPEHQAVKAKLDALKEPQQ